MNYRNNIIKKLLALSILLIFIFTLSACDIYSSTFSLGGRVIEEETEEGIEDVIIKDENSGEYVKTDDEGNWQLIGLSDEATIKAFKEDWVFEPSSVSKTESDMDIEFKGSGLRYDIAGQVVDDEGSGVEGVEIKFESPVEDFDSIITDSEGKFTKQDLIGEVELQPEKEDWDFSPSVKTVTGEDLNLEFEGSSLRYRIAGQIVDSDGIGVEGVEIKLESPVENYDSVITDAKGRFSKRDLIGEVELRPEKEFWGFSPTSKVVSQEEPERLNLEIEATSAFYTVSGQVINEHGEDVNDIIGLSYSDEEGNISGKEYTNYQGEFSISGLIGEIKITPEKGSYWFYPEYRTVSAERDDIIFMAQEDEYSISGKITDEDDGRPLENVKVSFESDDFGPYGAVYTDEEGEFSKSDLKGIVEVIPEKPGYEFTPVSREVARNDDGVDFKGYFREGSYESYSASGVVYDLAREPMENIIIEFYHNYQDGSGDLLTYAITDDGGQWSKDNLWGTVTVVPKGTPPDFSQTFEPKQAVISQDEEGVDFILYDGDFFQVTINEEESDIEVELGKYFTLEVHIENIGDEEGTQDIVAEINGNEVARESNINLASGYWTTRTLSFLATEEHHNQHVFVSSEDHFDSVRLTLDPLVPKQDEADKVSASNLEYGQRLSDSELSGTFINSNNDEEIAGDLVWAAADPDNVIPEESLKHQWKFVPENRNAYQIKEGTVMVEVDPADPIEDEVDRVSADNVDYNDNLSESTLRGTFLNPHNQEIVAGTFQWSGEPEEIVVEDGKEYEWIFTPDDVTKHNEVRGMALLFINPGEPVYFKNVSNIQNKSFAIQVFDENNIPYRNKSNLEVAEQEDKALADIDNNVNAELDTSMANQASTDEEGTLTIIYQKINVDKDGAVSGYVKYEISHEEIDYYIEIDNYLNISLTKDGNISDVTVTSTDE